MQINQLDMEALRFVVLIMQCISTILATYFFYKYKEGFLRFFIVIIWYSLLNEGFGKFYGSYISENNFVVYNVYRIVEFTFYLLLYKNLCEKDWHKKLMSIFLVFYYLSVFINCFYEDICTVYFANTYIFGASFIILGVIFYFSELINSEKIIDIYRNFAFYLSAAVLVIFVTSIPFKLIMKYYQESPTLPYIYLANYVLVFLFYLIISFGLIWSKEEQKQ